MTPQVDPWSVEREKRPGQSLLRVIDLEQDKQRWDVLSPRMVECLDYELDGCTLIYPSADRTPAETAYLIALYDALYCEQLRLNEKKPA